MYSDSHVIAVKKGDAATMTLMVTNNLGENSAQWSVVMANVGFVVRTKVVELFSCREVVVDGNGGLAVSGAGEALVSFLLFPPYFMVGRCLEDMLIVITGLLSRISSSRYRMVRILSFVLSTEDKYLLKSTMDI